MTTLRTITAALFVVALLAGCNFLAPEAESNHKVADAKPAAESAAPQGGVAALPCFGCHPYAAFNEAFPHETHGSMGLHCTQCHGMKAHKSNTIIGETCNNCHNMGVMQMKTSAMPAFFDHATHAAMFDCGKCHPESFPMKLNAAAISMADISRGKYCGDCHNGSVAFASDKCDRCHTR
ncbi:MAG: cytochrome c3 family protein [Nitrospirota bacterium]|jgi:c(7)-type cytochrome triheme protein